MNCNSFPPAVRGRRCGRYAPILLMLACLPPPLSAAGESAPPLEPLTVTAQRPQVEELQRALTPGGVTLVDGDELRERAVNNLSDAMRDVPGAWLSDSGSGNTVRISVRGSNLDATDYDNNGILLLQDGLPVSAADGSNHNRLPDPLAARRMVVMRGANALSLGASELGGAIDFVSRTARNSDPRQLSIGLGSHGLRSARASMGAVGELADGLLELVDQRDDGWREHSRQQRRSVNANLGLRLSTDVDLRLYASHGESRQELAGAIDRASYASHRRQANPAYEVGDHRIDVRSTRFAATGRWRIDAHSSVDFGLSFEDQALFHPIVYAPPFFSLLMDTRQRTLGGMLRYNLLLAEHDIVAGLNLAHSATRGGHYANLRGARGALQDRVAQRAATTTAFALDRWQLAPAWMLIYGVQGVLSRRVDDQVDGVDRGNHRARGQRDRFAALNPRVGLIHALTPSIELFTSASRIYQAPSGFDLDNARSERGARATLQAMRGSVLEVGVRGDDGAAANRIGFEWDVSAYWGRLRDEIVSADDPAAPGNTLTANAGRTTHAGLEALLGGRIPLGSGRSLQPRVSATLNHFRFADHPQYGDNRLPNAPHYFVHGELMYHGARGIYGGPTFDAVGARYADYANRRKVGRYGLLGLRAGIRRERWELFVEGRNLLDRRYVAMLGVLEQARPDSAVFNAGAGRSLYAGLNLHY